MNTKQLENRTTVKWDGYGSYQVTIIFRNKHYKCRSNNSLAYDRLNDDNHPPRWQLCGYTYKRALKAFYNECARANNLMF